MDLWLERREIEGLSEEIGEEYGETSGEAVLRWDSPHPYLQAKKSLDRAFNPDCWARGSKFLNSLPDRSFNLLAVIAARGITRLIQGHELEHAQNVRQILGLQYSNSLERELQGFIQDFAGIWFGEEFTPRTFYNAVEKLQKESADLVSQLEQKLQKGVTAVDNSLERAKPGLLSEKGTSSIFPMTLGHAMTLVVYRQLFLLSQPRLYDDLSRSVDPNRVGAYLNTPAGKGEKGEQVEEIVCISLASSVLGDKSPYELRILVAGLSGTGKNHFRECFRYMVGFRFIHFNYSNLEPEDLAGKASLHFFAGPEDDADPNFSGKILDEIRRNGIRNPLIEIDEVDFLDMRGEKESLYKELLGSHEDGIKGAMFCLHTNNSIREIPPPILRRCIVIQADPLTDDELMDAAEKVKIGRDATGRESSAIDRLRKREHESTEPFEPLVPEIDEDLRETAIKKGRMAHEKYKSFALSHNKDSGARTMQTVMSYVGLVAMGYYLLWQKDIPEERFQRMITRRSRELRWEPDKQEEKE